MKATATTKFKTVDEYLSSQPANTKSLLKELRKTIKKAAPEAEEVISYNMPAFKLNGVLVWYAAYREHIGFYPKPSALVAFVKELSPYEGSKGTVRFSIDQPLPLGLVSKIVKFRVKENLQKAKAKMKK